MKKPLVHNVNASFNLGIFTNKLKRKLLKLSPLFQKRDRQDI
jgi:hypothetical protein